MAQQFDATLKYLFTVEPEAWLKLLGVTANHVSIPNVDLSTVSSSADAILMVDDEHREAFHFEFQSGNDVAMGRRMLEYSVLASKSLRVPVRSVVVLLRPEADGASMSGHFQCKRSDGKVYLDFHFDVLRIWKLPVESFMNGGLGLMPLAFIADVEQDELPELLHRVKQRLKHDGAPKISGEILTAIDILMGLRYPDVLVEQLFKGVPEMEESVTYQKILAKGVARGEARGEMIGQAKGLAQGLRQTLIRQGTQRFGAPSEQIRRSIESIQAIERLEILCDRVLYAKDWDEIVHD